MTIISVPSPSRLPYGAASITTSLLVSPCSWPATWLVASRASSSWPTPEPTSPATDQPKGSPVIDLSPARDLLRADGADLELISEQPDGITVRLVLESAACAECVLPAPMLEQVASHLLGTRVRVEDPRSA